MHIELKILEHGKKFYRKEENLPGGFNKLSFDLPSYATPGSAAVDLRCIEDVIIHPGEVVTIKTGLSIHIGSGRVLDPDFYSQRWGVAGLLLPRSGLGADRGLVLGNLVGLHDEDYQGEILIKAWNRNERVHIEEFSPLALKIVRATTEDEVHILKNEINLKAGDRIAQMVFIPTIKAQWVLVDEFSEITSRGEGGWGSTGI